MLPNVLFGNLSKLAAGVTFVVILTTIGLAGCGSEISQNQSSSSGQESPASSVGQSVEQPTQQQPPGSPEQQPSGATDMTAILNRAAEILGIPSDDFIAAFNNAMPEGGAFGPGQQGQPFEPPLRPVP